MTSTIAVDVSIHGRVQGVAYRWHAAEEAQRLGVTGEVRNEPDGSVVVHAEGEGPAVEALVEWCRTGPPSARVERVDVRDAATTGSRTFEITA